MAVPAHDQRDFEFARTFGLKIIPVIEGEISEAAFDSKTSTCINSSSSEISINGLDYTSASSKIISWAESKKIGRKKYNLN